MTSPAAAPAGAAHPVPASVPPPTAARATVPSLDRSGGWLLSLAAVVVGTGPTTGPRIAPLRSEGQSGLIQLVTVLRHEIITPSYSNTFLPVGVRVLAAMPLAYFLPQRTSGGAGAAPVEM